MSVREFPRRRTDQPPTPKRPDASRKRLHSDPGRPSTARSMTPPSDVPTLTSVQEDASEEEREELRFALCHSNREQWDFEKMDPLLLRSLPRFSTSGDLPFMGDNSSASRIRSTKMSSDELTETFSFAGSSDEESILNSKDQYLRFSRSNIASKEETVKLRKIVTTSSTRLRKLGSKLRKVHSNLLARSKSAPAPLEAGMDSTHANVQPDSVSQYNHLLHCSANEINRVLLFLDQDESGRSVGYWKAPRGSKRTIDLQQHDRCSFDQDLAKFVLG